MGNITWQTGAILKIELFQQSYTIAIDEKCTHTFNSIMRCGKIARQVHVHIV